MAEINRYNEITINKEQIERNKKIIIVSIVGIIANIFLATFKAIIGFLTGSIAIVLDALNNTSDAASSVITIVGTKLANKAPDKEHPFGHGRIEYLTAMIIAILIVYAGITALIETIKKILNPIIPDYNTISLLFIAVAIIVKVFLSVYFIKSGKKLKSSSLKNSGYDAAWDYVISISTLIAAIIFITTKFSLEAYLGIIISLFIVRSGVKMLKESISSLLGERVDIELVKNVTKIVLSFEEVKGAYDLIINNYGPNTFIASMHIEVDEEMTAREIDKLVREISDKVYEKENVLLTAVGIYAIKYDEKTIQIRHEIKKILNNYEGVLQFHAFYVDEINKIIRFDVVLDFDVEDRNELFENLSKELSEKYYDYKVIITPDVDFSVSK